MASLERQSSGNYTIRFYFGKRKFNRSLNTAEEETAFTKKAEVEQTIKYIKQGVWTLPPNATYEEAGEFIVSRGSRTSKPTVATSHTLAQVVDAYTKSLPKQAKESTTINGETTHIGHLKRLLKGSTPMQSIGIDLLQRKYINQRAREKGLGGKTIQPATIKKEIQTFHQLWEFAQIRGWVDGGLSRKYLHYPKANDKPPFKAWNEIERVIKRGGLTEQEETELWESLFLREEEVLQLMRHVQEHAEHDFVVPMFAVAAFTGARRSEILRSEVDDFPLDGGPCWIREKKRRKNVSISFRQVPMLPPLKEILRKWLKKHPGGNNLICTPPNLVRSRTKSEVSEPLTKDQATDFFKRTLGGSKWEVVKGFHALRHSFASICATKGIPQEIIDTWMGHQTQEMTERYRHLFPEESQKAAATVFQDCGLFHKRR